MTNTENRIVKMQFDNAQFKRGAAETQKSLSDLDKSVAQAGKGKGLLDLSKQMEIVKVKASAMQVAVVAAIGTIASKVTSAGINMVKSFTLDPITSGFREYEKLLTSTQTIVANTGVNLKTASKYLNELNHYSDQTVYNFGQMADNIGRFTAAGVKLPAAVTAIKGLANTAALAGASTEQLNTAMYQMSQALATGRITLMDWNSLANAGMGGTNIQEAFKATARTMGVSVDAMIAKNGSFRESLQEGWLSADVFNKTMKVMAGTTNEAGKTVAFTVEEIQKMGYARKAAEDLHRLSKASIESATKIKTFSQLLEVVKESLGSAWASAFRGIFGGLEGSSMLWTKVGTVITDTIGNISLSINRAIGTWRKLGGFQDLWFGIGNVIKAVGNLFRPFIAIFQGIAPGANNAGKGMAAMTDSFYKFSVMLERTTRAATSWTPAITFVFNVIKGVVRGLSGLVKGAFRDVVDFFEMIGSKIDISAPKSGGFIDWVKSLVKELRIAASKVNELLEKGKSLTEAFGSIDIKFPKMPDLGGIGDIFSGSDDQEKKVTLLTAGVSKLSEAIDDVKKSSSHMPEIDWNEDFVPPKPGMPDLPDTGSMRFNPKARIDAGPIEGTADVVERAGKRIKQAGETLDSAGSVIGGILSRIGTSFVNFVKDFSTEDLVSSFNMAIFATMGIQLSRFLGALKNIADIGGAFENVLNGASSALGSFQTAARAQMILNIAIAIGILAASLLVLSLIPHDKLLKAFVALSATMLVAAGAMYIVGQAVEKMEGKGLGFKMIQISIAVGIFAASMLVLAAALVVFNFVKWDSIAKAGVALLGLSAALGVLALIPYQGIAKVGLAMLTAALAVESLARALVFFGFVKWEAMKKAGVALLGLTLALGALMILNKTGAIVGMLGMASAMMALAVAGVILGKVSWESIGKMAVVLTMLVVAGAAFAALLLVLGTVAGPIALLAGALALLAFGIAAVTASIALILPLMALGVGAFMTFATGAAIAFAVFVQTLAAQAPVIKTAMLKILQSMLDGLVEAVPMVIKAVKDIVTTIIDMFNKPQTHSLMGTSGQSWVSKLADGLKKKLPEITKKAVELLIAFLKGLASKAKDLATAGANVIIKFIGGIANKIGDIVAAGTNLILKFLDGIRQSADKLTKGAIELIAGLLHDLADNIRTGSGKIGAGITDVVDAMVDVGKDMIRGLIKGAKSLMSSAINAVKDIAGGMVDGAKGLLGIKSPSRVFAEIGKFLVQGLTRGIQNNAVSAITAVASMVRGQIAVANELTSQFIQKLDQQAIAARAKADGLRIAAERAAKAAEKTKTKSDDKKAAELSKAADAADIAADSAEARAEAAKAAQDRAKEFKEASSIEKARMRSEDAQNQLEAAKAAEQRAATKQAAARALEDQAKNTKLSLKARQELQRQAAVLREQARKEALLANKLLEQAKASAASALAWQKQAGAEAAAAFQQQFEAEAKADAEVEAFEKLSAEEKAKVRRQQAEALQKQAEADLAKAKELAFTDLEAANALANKALQEAEQARNFIDEAESLEQQAGGTMGTPSGTVVNLDPTQAAAIAFNDYADLYSAAVAAAAATPSVEFNQYNTSPESLNPIEVYRQTNNLLTMAAGQLGAVA